MRLKITRRQTCNDIDTIYNIVGDIKGKVRELIIMLDPDCEGNVIGVGYLACIRLPGRVVIERIGIVPFTGSKHPVNSGSSAKPGVCLFWIFTGIRQ
jgi:hypothetical protein